MQVRVGKAESVFYSAWCFFSSHPWAFPSIFTSTLARGKSVSCQVSTRHNNTSLWSTPSIFKHASAYARSFSKGGHDSTWI